MRLIIFILLAINLLASVIATGSKTGTYIQIGKNIQTMCSNKLPIEVISTRGSLDNYLKLTKSKIANFAIMQFDVLQYMKKIKDKEVNNVVMVYPLYDEELHLVVKKGLNVTKLSDLNNKRVAVGKKNSGSWVTAQLLTKKGHLLWNMIESGGQQALDALINNQLDAVLIIAGAPVKRLAVLPKEVNEVIKIANLNDPLLDNLYRKRKIKKDTYIFQPEVIHTYAITSILTAYKDDANKHNILTLYSCIDNNLAKLKRYGHPKWKEVTFKKAKEVKWKVYNLIKKLRYTQHRDSQEDFFQRDADNDIVIDNKHKLMWQDDKDTKKLKLNYIQAKKYCQNLTLGEFSDWRLPTIKELKTIIDKKQIPTINQNFGFIALGGGFYWTSTYDYFYKDIIQTIFFDTGVNSYIAKDSKNHIRCIRDIKNSSKED